MKKILVLASAIVLLASCNSETKETDMVVRDTIPTVTNTEPVTPAAYTPAEGDVTYRNSTVLVWRNGEWVKTEKDVTLENGVVVYQNGEVKKEGRTVRLKEGEVVNSVGNFFDKTGQAISNAWDSTKAGLERAGNAIDRAAQDVKDRVDGDRRNP